MIVLWIAYSIIFCAGVVARGSSSLEQRVAALRSHDDSWPLMNVSSCPGYTLSDLEETDDGVSARLTLAGSACNAFGHDVANLTLRVTYETQSRLHVNIFDTAEQQYTIPSDVVALQPGTGDASFKKNSEFKFHYDEKPFAFWVTRRDEPDAQPIFDTRAKSLPPTPIPPVIGNDTRTALDGFPLVFEDQYLQITSALPLNANIYGLGEVLASFGFRHDIGLDGGVGTIQTMWARNIPDPIDQNEYGSHPFYLEHRYNSTTRRSKTHGVFQFGAAGSDILLLTPPSSPVSLVEYRLLGGTLDFYFFSGPSPQEVIEQYGQLIGLPTWQPVWGFGFHLCRWGYANVSETREQVDKMREANIPLEVMDVFMKNQNGSEYLGQMWPGYTVFMDWFANNSQLVWSEAIANWSTSVNFSGIWLDVNEPTSVCAGSCGTGANLSAATIPTSHFPGEPGNAVTEYPEGYNSTLWGPSGNITINGTLTFGNNSADFPGVTFPPTKRGLGSAGLPVEDLNTPPYAIHNGDPSIADNTVSPNATHQNGLVELDVHNLWGMMEEKATHLALLSLRPNLRPFLISRSTFPSSGNWTGHWLGDNISKWRYMYLSIQGVLQFQLFQIPFVGADTCGFQGNTDEELCGRWMQLSAFMPFYRNHNVRSALSQEPYRWDSVANASRTAIAVRYSMLPYWASWFYTLFANASMHGTPTVRALFFEFPDEPELFSVDRQFLIGRDILVTPVLTPNVSTVDGIFPGQGRSTWRDWYTHEVLNASILTNTTLPAPLGHIPVHVRDGAALLLHAAPAYTIAETRAGPYELLVAQAADGYAFGTAYMDDGESVPPTPNSTLVVRAQTGRVSVEREGTFLIEQRLEKVTVLGAAGAAPMAVRVNGAKVGNWTFDAGVERLVVGGLGVDLNGRVVVEWA
ncbi:glycosyl hydrolases family 31-domain-containing protein [Epithele typhae]|uniref:glycosyl hydrolases family 31-domain-containing protein n=1 Tax=Epithele typhae TaxID=378194 RepID=UPI0020084AAB|nr:glycosyl hydrolases family 31-domain-containing protein [Epithele typhae]KAH9911567.1 glycosyl hydrolases family 31-domain-containing protein [Epithele typhae]